MGVDIIFIAFKSSLNVDREKNYPIGWSRAGVRLFLLFYCLTVWNFK
jgi:hypothetical protein